MQQQQQQQQQDQHHPPKMGCSGGPGGGGGGGGVLARFLSAPASWLDALLLELDEPQQQHPLLQGQEHQQQIGQSRPPTVPRVQLKTKDLPELPNQSKPTIADPSTLLDSAFTRHNSCPPEFLARLTTEDYFSGSEFDPSSLPDIPTPKRARESESTQRPSQSHAAVSDMELESLFQDSVPCRVRAKRGCATHPRSIAERVRRTRISDRIRKLQELVPNMDKQTNTADMLEEAVEYVKFLQKQVQAKFYDNLIPENMAGPG
ncbi:hypothetical protein Scep_019465 [Stephania cephalantha]|uniref:BHLH domain-containing protein n=1 Tax=Stephania cephalantha TaxID=152367 RepID=A0AAP0IBU5_9MAGN